MARRQIGQERLALGGAEPRGGTALDEVAALIDWAEGDGLLSGISASAKGEPGWPPLALFRALLLASGTTPPTFAARKLSTTAPRSGAFAASLRTSPRRNAPPLSASAPSW